MTDEQLEKYIYLIALFQSRFDFEEVYDLVDVVTAIYGYNEETLDNVNYYFTGYNSYSQLKELEESE